MRSTVIEGDQPPLTTQHHTAALGNNICSNAGHRFCATYPLDDAASAGCRVQRPVFSEASPDRL